MQVLGNGMTGAEEKPQDAKRRHILDCAFDVVLRYGYQRMTMDDVAKASGMSRPALYLHFRNKAEIYRAIARAMLDDGLTRAGAALAEPGNLKARLLAAIRAALLEPMDRLMETPHGAELFDMKDELAGDIMSEWRERKTALIARVLDAESPDKAGLNGTARAKALLDGMEGLKARARSSAERLDGAIALVALVV